MTSFGRILVILMLAASACSSNGSGDGGGPVDVVSIGGVAASEVQLAALEAPGTPVVEVIDAGAEPRSELRLTPTVGDTSDLEMAMKMSFEQSFDGSALPSAPVPTMVVPMHLEVVAADGDTFEVISQFGAYRLRDDAGVDPAVKQQMLGALAGMEGVTQRMHMTSRGALIEGSIDGVEGLQGQARSMTEQMETQMASMTVPLPDEAVGQGASWRATTALEFSGITSINQYTYRLVSVDGSRLIIQIQGSSVAPDDQTLQVPGLDGSATLTSLAGTFAGTNTVDLGAPVGLAFSTASGATDLVLSVSDGTDSGELIQRITIEMTFGPPE